MRAGASRGLRPYYPGMKLHSRFREFLLEQRIRLDHERATLPPGATSRDFMAPEAIDAAIARSNAGEIRSLIIQVGEALKRDKMYVEYRRAQITGEEQGDIPMTIDRANELEGYLNIMKLWVRKEEELLKTLEEALQAIVP